MKKLILILSSTLIGLVLVYGLALSLQQVASANSPRKTAPAVVVDLGTLGGDVSIPKDINNLGQIVGSSTLADGEAEQAFVWFEDVMTPLTLPAVPTDTIISASHAYGINEDGLIVGDYISVSEDLSVTLPLLWAAEMVTPLEVISATQATARDINDSGLSAGHSLTETENMLLVWQLAALTETTAFSEGLGVTTAVNNHNQIAGTIEDMSGTQHAFVYTATLLMDIGTLGGTSSMAYDINDLGQVVGTAALTDDISSHAFIWQDGVMQDLGVLAASGPAPTATSAALAVNAFGVVVGQSQLDGETHAVLWEDDSMLDLNTLLPVDSPWELLISATGINDLGLIIGTGLIDGELHGFLLQRPLPTHDLFLPIVPHGPSPTPTPTPTATPAPTSTPDPNSPSYDMTDYMISDGVLYEVRHSGGSQARHQTQLGPNRFYHTKGNEISAEWEELWDTSTSIYRGTDTSPGSGLYYTLYENNGYGSDWSPRIWQVGDIYYREPLVIFYRKSNCSIFNSGVQPSWLRFDAYHETYTFESGITLSGVVELGWLLSPGGPTIESYFYAKDFGLVGWGSDDRGYSYISEIHDPGARPDNKREVISCLQTYATTKELLQRNPGINLGPLPVELSRLVK